MGLAVVIGCFMSLELAVRAATAISRGTAAPLSYGMRPPSRSQPNTQSPDWEFDNRDGADAQVRLALRRSTVIPNFGTSSRINRFGLRGAEVAERKAPQTTRVLILGGSFVFGWGVSDAMAWPSVLERELNLRATASRYEVVNGGVNGANIDDLQRIAVQSVNTIEVDRVILVSAYNNHRLLSRPNLAQFADAQLGSLSLGYLAVRNYIQARRPPVQIRGSALRAGDLQAGLSHYKDRLERIWQLLSERKIELMVMVEPISFRDPVLDGSALIDSALADEIENRLVEHDEAVSRDEISLLFQVRLNGTLRDFANRRGLRILDPLRELASRRRSVFFDAIHPTAVGTQLIGKGVASQLVANTR